MTTAPVVTHKFSGSDAFWGMTIESRMSPRASWTPASEALVLGRVAAALVASFLVPTAPPA